MDARVTQHTSKATKGRDALTAIVLEQQWRAEQGAPVSLDFTKCVDSRSPKLGLATMGAAGNVEPAGAISRGSTVPANPLDPI